MAFVLKSLSLLVVLSVCSGQSVQVTLHTTAGCTDTVWFIQNQLASVYEEFKDYIDLAFVPWGRTTRAGDGTLSCQFGNEDCWANRVHRCALSMLTDEAAKLHYMDCEFKANTDRPAFIQGSYLCANVVGINLVNLDYCVSTTGVALDAQAEAAGSSVIQTADFVPTIVFGNNVPDYDSNMAVFMDFRTAVCAALIADTSIPVTSC